MNNRKIMIPAIAAAILAATTAASLAVPAIATGAVNVRTGPGTDYGKVGVLSPGEVVDAKQCQGSWCYVDRNSGSDGWVSKSYLAPPNAPAPAPAPEEEDLPFNFGVTVGPGGPAFSFGIGDAPPPAPPPGPTPEVCFYKGANYSGASFCVPAGADDPHLPGGWNDSISSVRLFGGAEATVCVNNWYAGACTTYSNNKPSLTFFNDKISSYQAF